MAVDKLVDSSQLDADLTSVANAIRTKGGTSAQLAFPAGFVSAIDAIQTGGGGTDYTVREVNVTGNYPTVDRDFTNFLFVAQVVESELPETKSNLNAYYLEFLRVNGMFVRKSGSKAYRVSTNGSAPYEGGASGASNTSVGATSITFSTYSSQNMFKGNWKVLQVELPDDFPAYSFYPLT